MIRALIGTLLILHGLAHAGAGVWAAGRASPWLVMPAWLLAMGGFLAAAFGVLQVPGLRRWWPWLMLGAAGASLFLLSVVADEVMMVGLLLDLVVVAAALRWADATNAGELGARPVRHRRLRRAWYVVAWSLLAYVAGLTVLRPWHTRWGTTPDERRMALPGDDAGRTAFYRIDHAITIQAPADSVWPWLVQMGQDRAGFYSYDWLERVVGDDIHNADRIVPEWQRLERGDLVRAAQPGYLGGILGDDIGWRVTALVPGRALVLEGWGAFVLEPVDSATTRLIVRTRGAGLPRLRDVPLAPFGFLVFEPAHFIMARAMLRGIRSRAEGAS